MQTMQVSDSISSSSACHEPDLRLVPEPPDPEPPDCDVECCWLLQKKLSGDGDDAVRSPTDASAVACPRPGVVKAELFGGWNAS